MKGNILCRGCKTELNDGIEMFIHNIMAEDGKLNCDRDAAIEYSEQIEPLKSIK